MTADEQNLSNLQDMINQVAEHTERLVKLQPALDEAASIKSDLAQLRKSMTELADAIATRNPNYGY